MGVVGLRDLFLVAPATSFHHHQQQQQQQQQQHQQHHQHHHQSHEHSILSDAVNASAATALGVGVGVFPLLTAPCLAQPHEPDDALNKSYSTPNRNTINVNSTNNQNHNNNNNISSGLHQFWQSQHPQSQQLPHHPNFPKKTMLFDHADNSVNLLQGGGGGPGSSAMPMTMASAAAATATCQDCGNQAKKDCSHRRCRTCCKNRGYDCSTHVKSTWVPAARRRERQLIGGGSSGGSSSGVKKARLVGGASQTTTTASHTSNSNNTPPRSFDTSSTHQDASFKETLPGQVRAPAVFRCVRVTALEEGEDEYAYQAAVKIGGHVFKGFLYDQGLQQQQQPRDDQHYPNLSDLHLGGGNGGGGRNSGVSTSSPMLDAAAAADVFAAASAGAFLGGGSAAYGNQIS